MFNTIIVHVHNRINNFDVRKLEFDFKVSTYLNNIVQLEHYAGTGNVIEMKKVDEKNTNFFLKLKVALLIRVFLIGTAN